VSVQNLATDANVYLDPDYAVVTRYGSAASLAPTTSSSASGTALPLASSATASSTAAANTISTTRTSSSPLIGALAGTLVLLLALSAGLWLVLRRLRQRRRRRAGVQVVEIRESRIGGGDLSFLSPNQLIVNPFSNPSPRSAECVLALLSSLRGADGAQVRHVRVRRRRAACVRQGRGQPVARGRAPGEVWARVPGEGGAVAHAVIRGVVVLVLPRLTLSNFIYALCIVCSARTRFLFLGIHAVFSEEMHRFSLSRVGPGDRQVGCMHLIHPFRLEH
jgi:hypothetical protein